MSMPRYADTVLRGGGVTLRAWQADDPESYLRVYSDELIAHWLHYPPVTDIETAKVRLASVVARSESMRPGLGIFALVPDEVGHPVGSLMLKPLDDTGMIEIGWNQAAPWTGSGFVTRGAELLLAHAFETVGLPYVHAIVLPDNARSLGVARRLGMRDTDALLTVEGFAHVLFLLTAEAWRARRSETADL